MDNNYEIGRIEFEKKYGGGIDWTKSFDQFIKELSDRKKQEKKREPASERFNYCSIWQLYREIERLEMALMDSCADDQNDYDFYYLRAKRKQNKEE